MFKAPRDSPRTKDETERQGSRRSEPSVVPRPHCAHAELTHALLLTRFSSPKPCLYFTIALSLLDSSFREVKDRGPASSRSLLDLDAQNLPRRAGQGLSPGPSLPKAESTPNTQPGEWGQDPRYDIDQCPLKKWRLTVTRRSS
ncbi:hypothetical protein E5288_WYG011600 [Bos mutus]|uniref:Uncharacterized protein n=1 Tax=Bos mutus TaxID=72004 RepID=A0A6B0RHR9_9CETA|nr:hypothetical protein [Bos mutus]